MRIHFKELTKLNPTAMSTVLKLVEETGELSREIQKFNDGFHNKELLPDLLGELMDVAQTTATLTFVLERQKKANIYKALATHLRKLRDKGYVRHIPAGMEGVSLQDGQLVLYLPKLDIEPDLTKTFLKLTEEAGELVQIVGKKSGLSGETKGILNEKDKETELSLALLDVAQCCVTMLYIMAEKYKVNVEELIQKHENKLRMHGYL